MHADLFLAAENDLGAVLAHLDEVKPGLLILDSVQTIASSDGGRRGRRRAADPGGDRLDQRGGQGARASPPSWSGT